MVERYLAGQQAVVSVLPHYTPIQAALQEYISRIQHFKQVQEVNQTGLTRQKDQYKEQLVTLAADTAIKLKAYATFSNLTVLLREIQYSENELRKSSTSALTDRSRIIHAKAQQHIQALGEYQLLQGQLDSLQSVIEAFVATVPDSRMGALTRKSATETLKNLFDEADLLLKDKLDVLVGVVRASHPDFYAGYQRTRMVVERRGRAREEKVPA